MNTQVSLVDRVVVLMTRHREGAAQSVWCVLIDDNSANDYLAAHSVAPGSWRWRTIARANVDREVARRSSEGFRVETDAAIAIAGPAIEEAILRRALFS